jgi:hypothetical protein
MWLVESQGDETVKAEVHDLQASWLEGTMQGSGYNDGATWYERRPYYWWSGGGAEGDYGGNDKDGDGIGDVSLRVQPNGTDNLPLMRTSSITGMILPSFKGKDHSRTSFIKQRTFSIDPELS